MSFKNFNKITRKIAYSVLSVSLILADLHASEKLEKGIVPTTPLNHPIHQCDVFRNSEEYLHCLTVKQQISEFELQQTLIGLTKEKAELENKARKNEIKAAKKMNKIQIQAAKDQAAANNETNKWNIATAKVLFCGAVIGVGNLVMNVAKTYLENQ